MRLSISSQSDLDGEELDGVEASELEEHMKALSHWRRGVRVGQSRRPPPPPEVPKAAPKAAPEAPAVDPKVLAAWGLLVPKELESAPKVKKKKKKKHGHLALLRAFMKTSIYGCIRVFMGRGKRRRARSSSSDRTLVDSDATDVTVPTP